VIYVDSGPLPDGLAINADLPPDAVEIPVPEFDQQAHDLDDDVLATFASRTVPHPAGPARDPVRVSNPARHEVPAIVICCTYSSDQVRKLAAEGMPFFAELRSLHVTYVDLPTGHYPMWSRPTELAAAIDSAASGAHRAT
jgi:hypothetical protein